jgi:hypothetical protein
VYSFHSRLLRPTSGARKSLGGNSGAYFWELEKKTHVDTSDTGHQNRDNADLSLLFIVSYSILAEVIKREGNVGITQKYVHAFIRHVRNIK